MELCLRQRNGPRVCRGFKTSRLQTFPPKAQTSRLIVQALHMGPAGIDEDKDRSRERVLAQSIPNHGYESVIGQAHVHGFAVQKIPTHDGHHADFLNCSHRPGNVTRSSKDQSCDAGSFESMESGIKDASFMERSACLFFQLRNPDGLTPTPAQNA